MSFWRRITTPVIIYSTLKHNINKNIHSCAFKNVNITSIIVTRKQENILANTVRCKSKKQNQYDSDDDEDSFHEDSSLSKDSKIIKLSATSMRTDMVLKSVLGVSRNKIEQMFYESKIRVNGKKIMKKSASLKLGDEVDVIKMVSPKNPDHLYVARVEILDVTPKEESISITARRFKNLLIENYEIDPHKGGAESDM